MINVSSAFDIARNLFAKCSMIAPCTPLPLRFILELTHRCNLNCPFCYLGKNKLESEMSALDWIKIINQIPFYSFITFVGGEPLIRKDFIEIFIEASKKVFNKTHLVTNGVLLNDEIINALVKYKLLLLSVSLDGWGENHDKIRGSKKNHKSIFNKILNNLDNLSQQSRLSKTNIIVDIKTIVLKDNLQDILKLYEFATNKGFDFFSISFLRNNNLKQNAILSDTFLKEFYVQNYPIEQYFDMKEFEQIYLEMQKIKKYSKTTIRFAPKFESSNSKEELNKIKNFFQNGNKIDMKNLYEPCLYPWSNVIINPLGDIYPCLSYKMGNIKENKIKDIINSKKYKLFKDNLKNSKMFSACQMCCELKVKVNK